LIIDDDEDVLRAVERQLVFLGYETTVASDGEEGLRLFREATVPFSIVLLDRTMPRLSGDQVLKELHALAPQVPVVVMSGWSADDFTSPGDTVTFLEKPMTLSELTQAIERVRAAARDAVQA
jgi:DNA-binding NtrC family response regulator